MSRTRQFAAKLATDFRRSAAMNISRIISRMDRCRTHRCPAHSALRFSWPECLLAEACVSAKAHQLANCTINIAPFAVRVMSGARRTCLRLQADAL